MKRSELRFITVICDLTVMSLMLLGIWSITYLIKREKARHKRLLFETSDFGVKVENLPEVTNSYTMQMLKADLLKHIKLNLQEHHDSDEDLKDVDPKFANQILDINFVMSNSEILSSAKMLNEKKHEILLINQTLPKTKGQRKIQKLEDKKKKLQEELDEATEKYIKSVKANDNQAKVVGAFILFRTVAGAERMKDCFKQDTSLLGGHTDEKKVFKEKVLEVEGAVEPEIILWENFGFKYLFLRRVVYIFELFIFLVLLFSLLYGINHLKSFQEGIQPDLQCPRSVTMDDAFKDFQTKQEERTGDYHCYCKNLLETAVTTGLVSARFPDGEKHCNAWLQSYAFYVLIDFALIILTT